MEEKIEDGQFRRQDRMILRNLEAPDSWLCLIPRTSSAFRLFHSSCSFSFTYIHIHIAMPGFTARLVIELVDLDSFHCPRKTFRFAISSLNCCAVFRSRLDRGGQVDKGIVLLLVIVHVLSFSFPNQPKYVRQF